MNRYAPLNLVQPMNVVPQEYLKLLPRFTREDEVTTEQHLPLFCTFDENLNVKHLDVVMKLLCSLYMERLENGSKVYQMVQ